MSSQRIEKILERYFHGETSLTEEGVLKEYFRQESLPPHLVELKELFSLYEKEKNAQLPDDFDEALFEAIGNHERSKKASRRSVIYYVASVAATILIIITVFIRFDPLARNSANSAEAEEAFAEASRVLYFVSDKFMQGTKPMGKVTRFNEGIDDLTTVKKFDDGVEKTAAVSKFNQITDLIINPAPEQGAK